VNSWGPVERRDRFRLQIHDALTRVFAMGQATGRVYRTGLVTAINQVAEAAPL
jgi:hypothetical protein